MKAKDLFCTGPAQAAAEQLEQQFPDVMFTSGRRGATDQARAMASNIIHNRRWIAETYRATDESRALQAWVDSHPQAMTAEAIAAGLLFVMFVWDDAQRSRLSKHFSGEAWDVAPMAGARGQAVCVAIRKLPGLKKFLTREGGLIRWHAQF